MLRKSISYIQYIFIRHDNERKFNYTQLCINVCHFFLFLFARSLRRWRRSRGNYIAAFLWKISRAWKKIELRDRFLWYPGRCIWSRKFLELRTVFKDTFLVSLRAPERAETRSGNSKSSLRANFIPWGNKKRVFSPLKCFRAAFGVRTTREKSNKLFFLLNGGSIW